MLDVKPGSYFIEFLGNITGDTSQVLARTAITIKTPVWIKSFTPRHIFQQSPTAIAVQIDFSDPDVDACLTG